MIRVGGVTFVRQFADELNELNEALLEMGSRVESSIHSSVQALVEHNDRIAQRVREDETRINELEKEIDARVTRLLALRQPVAKDLRFLIMALKINTDLERMGDNAAKIAFRAMKLNRSRARLGEAFEETPRMGMIAEDMIHRTLDAFVNRDAQLAKTVLPADEEVDRIRDRVYSNLIELMQRVPEAVPDGVDLMFVVRSLERVADHAVNVAEDVIYLVEGVDIRHDETANQQL